MKQEGLTAAHGILVSSEIRQAMSHEITQGGERLLARHRQLEIVDTAWIRREFSLNHASHFPGESVGGKTCRSGQILHGACSKALPVVGIKAPGAAYRATVRFQQHPVTAPHRAIERIEA